MNVVVTLVHGTWGRGFLAAHCRLIQRHTGWTEDGAPLVQAIHRALGPALVISRFDWSGRNSHRARLRAAEELARHLTDLVVKYPNAAHAVLTHSHGGNVALYALRKSGLAEAMNAVICMATPFVIVRHRAWTAASLAVLKIAALFPLGLAGAFLVSAFVPQRDPETMRAIGYATLAALIGGSIIFWLLTEAIAQRPRRLAQDARLCHMGDRLVIVRAPGDEASLVLAASALIERLGRMTVQALQRFLVPLALVLIGLVAVVMTLGLVLAVPILASVHLGKPDLVWELTWIHVAAGLMFMELGGLAAAVGLAVVLAVPMVLAMFVGSVAFGLDAGLPRTRALAWELLKSDEEQVRRFESRFEPRTRTFVWKLLPKRVKRAVQMSSCFVAVVKDAWRPDSLTHTAIHDDPRVVEFVAAAIARIEPRASAAGEERRKR